MEICKFCGCRGLWKAGVINEKQRYRCKSCNRTQGATDERVKYSEEERRQALVLYLEGCGFRKIARIMGKLCGKNYRYQTIMHWIKVAGLKVLSEKTKQEKVDVLHNVVKKFLT